MELTRRDVTVAGIVTFIAWGYAVHWLPILRYLAYSFVAGFTVTSIAIGAVILSTSRAEIHDGTKAYSKSKNAAFVVTETWKEKMKSLEALADYRPAPLYPPSFVISDSLETLLNLILRDFITSWYSHISRSLSFTNEVDRALRTALVNLRDRVVGVDIVEVTVSRFIPIITEHLREFDQAERAIRGKKLNRDVTWIETEGLDLAIAGKYKEGKLHPAASLSFSNTKLVQQEHLRRTAVRVLPEVLPENVIRSRAVSVLLKEIVACAILSPVMQLLSDPDTWNQLMEAYGRTMLHDRKSVRKLRAALDAHASPAPRTTADRPFPKLAVSDNERKFERFIRAIRQCNNLSDARRFRSEVASQIMREAMVEEQDETYLRRLGTGKRILDQKVGKLSTAGGLTKDVLLQTDVRNGHTLPGVENPTIVEILRDAQGLSYFMEYMDRHHLMTLVQFWVVVDGFRNPLEEDFLDDEASTGALLKWTDSDRLDIAQINDTYLSKPELNVPEVSREAIKSFSQTGRSATPVQYQRARGAILRAQTAILDEMRQQYFPEFKRSDLYYKYLASDESSAKPGLKVVPKASRQLATVPIKEVTSHPPLAPRAPTRVSARDKDLRRTAASSTDLNTAAQRLHSAAPQRRSFEISPSTPLFPDNDYDTDPLARSAHSIDIDIDSLNSTQPDGAQAQMVQAMEAALNDIMDDEPQTDDAQSTLFESPDPSLKSPHDLDSSRSFVDFPRTKSPHGDKERERPNLASLGLVNMSSRMGVFSEDDLFDDEEKFLEDERADLEDAVDEKDAQDEIIQAAPGDLGLAEAISALTADIERLAAQDSIVDTLNRKAELTNNTAELRILGKSKSSLQREIRRKELQRQQYIVQESDNSLYGRATVEIKSVMVGKDEDGQEFALYVIQVQRKAGEEMPAASWAVARRYSEFHDLYQRLRVMYPAVRHLDFPRRRLVMKLQKDFLQKRRSSLEKYLRELLRMPAVCRSRDLRAFLSQQAIISAHNAGRDAERRDIVTRIYNSVTDGMDDFIGNIPVLDQLSVAGQNLISAATSQLSTMPPAAAEGSVSADEAEAELNAYETRELEPFVKPICDMFLEVFELKRGNSWLRGRAVVVVLHQLLGGTVERKVREYAKVLVQEDSILKYINLIKDTMWPMGQARREVPFRTDAEKTRSRKEASVMLATLIPDLAGNIVGRANAQAASRRIFATLNNPRLNSHLAFTLLDEVVQVLFGDVRSR